MRPFLQGVLLSVVFTCAVGQAQRLCQPANQNPTMYYPKGGLNWYVTELQPSRPMQVSALQFILRNYSPATMPIPFAVWASDPAGKPGTVLAKKTIQLPAGPHIAWHGARFDQRRFRRHFAECGRSLHGTVCGAPYAGRYYGGHLASGDRFRSRYVMGIPGIIVGSGVPTTAGLIFC